MRLWLSSVLLLTAMAGFACNAHADWFGLPFGGAASSSTPNLTPAKRAAVSTGSETKTARVMWLDKQTNRKQLIVLNTGTTQTLNGLNVALTKCMADYDNVLLQDVAWLEVTENSRAAPWFAGWMFNTYPEVATLDHPRYDLQLIGCGEQARAKPAAKIVAPVTTETRFDAHDSEAPEGDSEAPSGDNDPYYVPGVGGDNEAPATPANPAVPPIQPAPAAPATPEYQPERPVTAPAAPTQVAPQAAAPVTSPPVVNEVRPMEANAPATPADTGELRKMMDTGGTY